MILQSFNAFSSVWYGDSGDSVDVVYSP